MITESRNKYGKKLYETNPAPFKWWVFTMLFFFSVVLFVVISNDHNKHDLPSLIFGYACAFLLFLWSFYYMTINREKALYTFYEHGISGFKRQTGHHFIPWSDIQDISLQSVEINGTTITYFVIHPP